jgi:hypothetical protein
MSKNVIQNLEILAHYQRKANVHENPCRIRKENLSLGILVQ